MQVHVLLVAEPARYPFLCWAARDPWGSERLIATLDVPDEIPPEKISEHVKSQIFPLRFERLERGEWQPFEDATDIVEKGYQLANIWAPLSKLRDVFGDGYRLATCNGDEIAIGRKVP